VGAEDSTAFTGLVSSPATARPTRTIGDPAPATRIEDLLRACGADEVLVVTADAAESWQERVEIERVLDELDVPVVQIPAEIS
jgi:hypothetical protein